MYKEQYQKAKFNLSQSQEFCDGCCKKSQKQFGKIDEKAGKSLGEIGYFFSPK